MVVKLLKTAFPISTIKIAIFGYQSFEKCPIHEFLLQIFISIIYCTLFIGGNQIYLHD